MVEKQEPVFVDATDRPGADTPEPEPPVEEAKPRLTIEGKDGEKITTDDIVDGAHDIRDRAVNLIDGEAREFVSKWFNRLKGVTDDVFDRLEGKNKDESP